MRFSSAMYFRGLVGAVLFAAVAGCAVGPDYKEPEMALPEDWYRGFEQQQTATEGEAEQPAALGEWDWWQLFQDPQLQALIRQALEHNRDLKVAVLNVEKSRAQHGFAHSGLFPSVGLDLLTERENDPKLAGGDGSTANNHEYYAEVSWELDLWGARHRASEAAYAEYLGSGYGWRGVRLLLISDVAANWFALQGVEAELAINRDTLEARQRAYVIAEKRFRGGLTSKLEVQQAKVELAAAQAAVPALLRQRLDVESNLSTLLGRPPEHFVVERGLPEQYVPLIVRPGLPSNLLQRRPDILQAERALQAASERIGIAKAAYFPTITLTGQLGYETLEFSDLLDSGGKKWLAGGNLLMPIFNAGALDAQYDIAEIEFQQARLGYEKIVLQSLREVSSALNHFHQSGRILTANEALEQASSEYLLLATKRYRNGVLAYIDVLDAQRSLLDAQLSASDARELQLQSMIELYKALGGGWDLALNESDAVGEVADAKE